MIMISIIQYLCEGGGGESAFLNFVSTSWLCFSAYIYFLIFNLKEKRIGGWGVEVLLQDFENECLTSRGPFQSCIYNHQSNKQPVSHLADHSHLKHLFSLRYTIVPYSDIDKTKVLTIHKIHSACSTLK